MEDSVDRHLARWRGKAPYDERAEAVITRMQKLVNHVKQSKRHMLAESGLHEFEFATLHRLAARDRPWRATPTELAAELMLSPAGMTGRLDTLEEAGLIRRVRGTGDRRRVDVEMTDEGYARWLAAMEVQGVTERTIVAALSEGEQDEINTLLKKMLLLAEGESA